MSRRDVIREIRSLRDERLTVRVPAYLLAEIERLCAETDATQSEVALRLIEAGIRALKDPRDLWPEDEKGGSETPQHDL